MIAIYDIIYYYIRQLIMYSWYWLIIFIIEQSPTVTSYKNYNISNNLIMYLLTKNLELI